MIRILSYNVMFGRRSKNLFPWLSQQNNIDIYCLQEFPEHKIDQLKHMFPHYQCGFAPSMRLLKKTYGVLTLTRTKMTMRRISLGRHRMALATVCTHEKRRIVLINLHLSWLATNKRRYGEIEKILDDIKSYRTPICIIGDFNIPSYIAKNKLLTYMRVRKFVAPERRMATYRPAKYQLDYVFVRKAKIKEVTIDRVRFSDHYPVTAEILFQK